MNTNPAQNRWFNVTLTVGHQDNNGYKTTYVIDTQILQGMRWLHTRIHTDDHWVFSYLGIKHFPETQTDYWLSASAGGDLHLVYVNWSRDGAGQSEDCAIPRDDQRDVDTIVDDPTLFPNDNPGRY